MTISIWRYSHLILAISSSLFLLLASITGVILAIEPIDNKLQSYYISDSENLSVSKTMENLSHNYNGILSINKDKNDFISITTVINGSNESFYINPFTGKKIGDIIEKAPIYKFATNLHRSLFLKSIGRFFIGLTSFLLFLIAVTGVILIAKRQGGIFKFFSPLVKENFSQYYHIIISRIVLIPIVIIAASGVYLSLLRFSILPETNIVHTVDYENIKDSSRATPTDFAIFSETKLSELKTLEYPFSDFIEDNYLLKLNKKEIIINQFTGEILSEQEYPFTAIISNLASVLHTGTGSASWSIVLGLATLAIPFLIYSGFVMSLRRPKTKIKNKFSKNNSKYIILVGSEGGSTLQYARLVYQELINAGESCFMAEMNNYSSYKQMEHLIIITATYGQGKATTNAKNFIKKFKNTEQNSPYSYSIVGFGSTSYPDFCQFAYEVDNCIDTDKKSNKILELHTVNNKSFESFSQWVNLWSKKVGVIIKLNKLEVASIKKKTSLFNVVHKTNVITTNNDNSFLLQLKSLTKTNYNSGDLLAVYPENDSTERLYSISKVEENNILISIKKHDNGVCSNYLNNLQINNKVEAYIIKNKDFHFPKKAPKIVFIATGTGIGPFLGMIKSNHEQKDIIMYWGARTKASYMLYKDIIEDSINNNKLKSFNTAYSKATENKIYVQHLIEKDQENIAALLKEKGVIMICGSITMQNEVLQTLEKICIEKLGNKLSYYQNKKQIKMDCY